MDNHLKISAGQHSDRGRKETNQDCLGILVPEAYEVASKGIAVALADGISSSDVSHIASNTAVRGFLADYFCTSDAWSVKKSAQRVLAALNSWLYSQTRRSPYRYDTDRGYVCTLSAMIMKSMTAHVFHVGDTRIYRLRENSLEQLTTDHRIRVSRELYYLSRALGLDSQLEIDYQALTMEEGDVFLFASDGVYEYAPVPFMLDVIHASPRDLDYAAKAIVDKAYEYGSPDNLTVQIVRVDAVPRGEVAEVQQQLTEWSLPPVLEAGTLLDGYRILRELHASARSHIYMAVDSATGATVVLKTPSIALQDDRSYLERLLLEEWVARRIDSTHVLKAFVSSRKRNYIFAATEFIEGQTLSQWIVDHPKPGLETVRVLVEQMAQGLQAFHRLEMLHQDLRPDNVMIDVHGTARIIDFGSTRVAGIEEISLSLERSNVLGTAQYTAPEYMVGEDGSERSDIFSLGVITYQMLSGKLPYGAQVAKCKTRAAQRKLRYRTLRDQDLGVPTWVDGAIKKAVHPDPAKRYEEVSEFVFDLRHPNRAFLHQSAPPLIERNPLVFWKSLSAFLAFGVLVLLAMQHVAK